MHTLPTIPGPLKPKPKIPNEGIRDGRSLFALELEGNGIGDAGGAALGKALAYNKSLETLDLRGNAIRDTGTPHHDHNSNSVVPGLALSITLA